MATAPAWLREAFRDGVDEREGVFDSEGGERFRSMRKAAYSGASPWCWLAQHDPAKQPCQGQPAKMIERFHFIPRQRVGNALFALLPPAEVCHNCEDGMHRVGTEAVPECCGNVNGAGECRGDCAVPVERVVEEPCWVCGGSGWITFDPAELIMLAEWDARNAGLACEHHHRRYDGHACSPRAPRIVVRYEDLPSHVIHFAFGWGVDAQLDRFPSEI